MGLNRVEGRVADHWVELGFVLFEQGDLRGAECAFRQAIQAGSDGGWAGLGDLCAARGEHTEAQAMYRRALEAGYRTSR